LALSAGASSRAWGEKPQGFRSLFAFRGAFPGALGGPLNGALEQLFGRIQQARETGQCETQPDGPRTTCGAQTKHERIPMFRTLMIGAVSALALSTAAFAQQGPQEARAMLDKAIAAVKADQA